MSFESSKKELEFFISIISFIFKNKQDIYRYIQHTVFAGLYYMKRGKVFVKEIHTLKKKKKKKNNLQIFFL